MSGKKLLIGIVLLDFAALTLYAMFYEGPTGLWQAATGSKTAVMLTVDLLINLTLVNIWMYVDAKKHQIRFAPFALLSLTTGGIGPLAYLYYRENAKEQGTQPVATHHESVPQTAS